MSVLIYIMVILSYSREVCCGWGLYIEKASVTTHHLEYWGLTLYQPLSLNLGLLIFEIREYRDNQGAQVFLAPWWLIITVSRQPSSAFSWRDSRALSPNFYFPQTPSATELKNVISKSKSQDERRGWSEGWDSVFPRLVKSLLYPTQHKLKATFTALSSKKTWLFFFLLHLSPRKLRIWTRPLSSE